MPSTVFRFAVLPKNQNCDKFTGKLTLRRVCTHRCLQHLKISSVATKGILYDRIFSWWMLVQNWDTLIFGRSSGFEAFGHRVEEQLLFQLGYVQASVYRLTLPRLKDWADVDAMGTPLGSCRFYSGLPPAPHRQPTTQAHAERRCSTKGALHFRTWCLAPQWLWSNVSSNGRLPTSAHRIRRGVASRVQQRFSCSRMPSEDGRQLAAIAMQG